MTARKLFKGREDSNGKQRVKKRFRSSSYPNDSVRGYHWCWCLFMGSASTIKWTGPSVLLAYAISGIFIYLVMRAMGEMLYVEPSTGSFATFGHKYIHPLAGYLTAWSNWFQWVIVGMSEIIAVGQYMQYWFPDLPGWIPGIIAMLILGAANLISVKSFGEIEFWFAMIKIITIVLMIVAGFGLIFFGLGNGGNAIGLENLWKHEGFFLLVAGLASSLHYLLSLLLIKELNL